MQQMELFPGVQPDKKNFAHHNFSKPIPNPTVRKIAETNSVYLKKFKPKVWTKIKNSSQKPTNHNTALHLPHFYTTPHSKAVWDMPWLMGGELLSPSLLPTSK